EVNYNLSKLMMSLEVSVPLLANSTKLGFGFSNRGGIKNADIVIIRSMEDQIFIDDCWCNKNGEVRRDVEQNYNLIRYSKINNYVWQIDIERSFDTCDDHDYQLDSGTTNIIVIYPIHSPCKSIHINLVDCNISKVPVTLRRAQLLKPEVTVPKTHAKWFDIVAPNVTIPRSSTTYWCNLQQLPPFKRKVHGVGFAGVISNPDLVHHIEVYLCDIDDLEIPSYNGICNAKQMPVQLTRCNHVLAAWAFGAEAFYYPKEAGLAFDSATMSPYVRLEIHYNNPHHLVGRVDHSGIRFYYTEQLRQYDVGILETGVTYSPNMAVPPHQTSFEWAGICPASCTRAAIPPSGINIFASELHTHLLGRKAQTTLLRSDGSSEVIERDRHYSTWFEEIRYVTPVISVKPGDSLITTCAFDSIKKKNVTLGGLGLQDEMCVGYLHYYPVSQLEVCKSSVSRIALEAFFKLISLLSGKPTNIRPHNLHQNYNEITWGPAAARSLQALYRDSPVDVKCLRGNGKEWGGKWDNVRSTIPYSEAVSSQDVPNERCGV
uniref:Dopamine beta-hydroxylase n=1 Tax=Ciona savignyi TaxID=51511 RepID=H2ZA79_CIOSA